MPGCARRKYTAEQEGMFKIRVLDILNNSENSLTIDEIKMQDPINLSGVTSQKLSRVLGSLIDMGLAKKGKSKSTNRMVYKAVSKMLEQGYEVEGQPMVSSRAYNGFEWDFEDELRERVSENEDD